MTEVLSHSRDVRVYKNENVNQALAQAIRFGLNALSAASGYSKAEIQNYVSPSRGTVPIKLLAAACRLNSERLELPLQARSLAECLKGANVLLGSGENEVPEQPMTRSAQPEYRRTPAGVVSVKRLGTAERRSLQFLGVATELLVFMAVGWYVGFYYLSKTFSVSQFVGGAIGVVVGAILGNAWLAYYFLKRV